MYNQPEKAVLAYYLVSNTAPGSLLGMAARSKLELGNR